MDTKKWDAVNVISFNYLKHIRLRDELTGYLITKSISFQRKFIKINTKYKKLKRNVLTVIAIIVFLAIGFFYFAFPKENSDIQYNVTEISSKDVESKLYIKKKVWGMTSDNQMVVISNSNEKEFIPVKSKNYIYNGLMPLFYKVKNDTLTIYTYEISAVPKDLKTKFNIIQVLLENPEMMKLIEHDNYKKMGLQKVD